MAEQQKPTITIRPAIFPTDKQTVADLFLAYANSIPVSLDFQNFQEELSQLPGKYQENASGAVFLACIEPPMSTSADSLSAQASPATSPHSETIVGVAALRRFARPGACELKRLYLTPASRGLGAGKALVEVALQKAREFGYSEMLLDTLASMTAARRLYEGLGFVETEKYYESLEGVVYYRCDLGARTEGS